MLLGIFYRYIEKVSLFFDKMMERSVETFFKNLSIPLYAIALSFHSLGIYLMTNVQTRNRIQDIIIINLSITEIFMSICECSQNIILRFNINPIVVDYFIVLECALFVLPSVWIMGLLALNRFLEIYLNIKYNLIVNRKRIRIPLIVFWVIGVLNALTLVYLRSKYDTVSTIIFKFLLPTSEALFVFIAVGSYSYIWKKFCEQRTKIHRRSQQFNRQRMGFLKKKFFPPFLIIVAFFIFVLIPDLLNLVFLHVLKLKESPMINSIIQVLYVIGFICDALIYIFLQPHVARLLYSKLRLLRAKSSNGKGSSTVARNVSSLYSDTNVTSTTFN